MYSGNLSLRFKVIQGGKRVNWKKRLLFVAVVILGMTLFTACNDDNKAGSNEEVDDNGRPTITMMINLHTPEVPGDKILDLVEDATNVNLDIEWVPDNNYSEKLNTAFATDTLPEVVSVGADQMDQFKEAIRDDQFWEVGPYLDEYENLGKLKDTIVENTKINGKVYGLYQGRPLSNLKSTRLNSSHVTRSYE